MPSVLGQRRPQLRDICISWVWQVVATGWQPDTVCFWFFPIIQSEHDFMRMRRKMGTIKHPNHIYSTNLYRCFSGVSTPAARESPRAVFGSAAAQACCSQCKGSQTFCCLKTGRLPSLHNNASSAQSCWGQGQAQSVCGGVVWMPQSGWGMCVHACPHTHTRSCVCLNLCIWHKTDMFIVKQKGPKACGFYH